MGNIKNTLIELVIRHFKDSNNKKRSEKAAKKRAEIMSHNKPVIIAAILHKTSKQSAKKESKEKKQGDLEDLEDVTSGKPKSENIRANSGYGINSGYADISKHYGISPAVVYTDYNKIWSHLGKFKAGTLYDKTSKIGAVTESSREMVSEETVDKATKHFKYFVRGEIVGDFGFVPPVGINIDSKDWEKYRFMSMLSIYRPLLKLKMTTL
ncbi:hypothetical protein HYX01_02320 [Candidatus Woesearchaeota archaeon]|nr:hypothetical protein [Candidatus Woesearchaeota archaeon]